MKFFSPSSSQRKKRRSRPRRHRGVAVVEAALCLVFVLLPVTLGGFQFAMVFMTQHALQQITRESARFAAVRYSETTFDMNENQGNSAGQNRSLKNIIRSQSVANGIDWKEINGTVLPGGLKGSIVVTPSTVAARSSGQPITITITYPMKRRALLGSMFFRNTNGSIAPLSLGFLQNNFSASATTLME